jgi:ATP synthase I chain
MVFRGLADHVPRAVQAQLVVGLAGALIWGAFGTGRLAAAASFGGVTGVILGIYTSVRVAVLQGRVGSPGQGLWALIQMEIIRLVLAIAALYLAFWLFPDAFVATLSTFIATLVVFPFLVQIDNGDAREH